MTFFLEKRNFLKIKKNKKFEPPLENLSYAPDMLIDEQGKKSFSGGF